jgi:hypothetical protein
MEYFVVLINNKPVKVTGALLEALRFLEDRQAVIHRIHYKDDKLVVQEIAIKTRRDTS